MSLDIYLDIDGVILANDKVAAKHAPEFLEYLTSNFQVYWLTTHVHGDADWVKEYLSRFFDTKTMELIDKIQVTPKDWVVAKTEAIDFTKPFLWIDDDLYDEEKLALEQAGKLDRWVEVDLAKDEGYLLELINSLPTRITT